MTARIDGPADGGPFALDKLLAFAESKPADESYDSTRPCECALAQYVSAIGGVVGSEGDAGYQIDGVYYNRIASTIIGPAYRLVMHGDSTFGALADRLRAALAARKAP